MSVWTLPKMACVAKSAVKTEIATEKSENKIGFALLKVKTSKTRRAIVQIVLIIVISRCAEVDA